MMLEQTILFITIRMRPQTEKIYTKKLNLLKTCLGFTEKNQKNTKIGNLKDKLVVKEAIVAIPYTQADESRQKQSNRQEEL